MKKLSTVIISFFISSLLYAQDSTKKIIKITYKSIPVSQYAVSNDPERSAADKVLDLELKYAHKRYYSLYINLKTRASIYKFDSLNFVKPKGREDVQLMLADELEYCFKPDATVTYKYERLFGRKFYCKGKTGDITWQITKEKKQLLGFECTKAVSKNKGLYLTVWFTNSIPVSCGPVNYFGLPGLVVWAEDFFRTTQIEKIEYSNDEANFDRERKNMQTNFDTNKKKDFMQEPRYMVEKTELIESLRAMMNSPTQK